MTPPAPDVRRPRLRPRRNPVWLVAGLLAISLGGLASAFLFSSAAATDDVLVLTRTVHRGEVIDPSDLAVVAVGAGDGLATVPGERVSEVTGQAALTDLPRGSLLVHGSWGATGLREGVARVGLRLEAGHHPADLLPGSTVLVVALPDAGVGAAPADPDAALPASVPATVVAAPVVQPDGAAVVDVTLPAEQAETVARLAAAGRVALVERLFRP